MAAASRVGPARTAPPARVLEVGDNGVVKVASASDPTKEYAVRRGEAGAWRCECAAAHFARACWHIEAADRALREADRWLYWWSVWEAIEQRGGARR